MSVFEPLPGSIIAGGKEYAINTDFRVWIKIESIIFNSRLTDAEKLSKMFVLAMPVLPSENLPEAAEALVGFCFNEKDKTNGAENQSKQPLFDYEADSEYIYAAFISEFGIDLSTSKLHFHKFKALLKSLGDGCKFTKIISYRGVNTSKIKDKEQRSFYENMKRLYALPDSRTDEEKDADFAESLSVLF